MFAAGVAVIAGCSSSEQNAEERACSGAAALSVAPLDGQSLDAKQLALTFDDGPGLRTVELSAYLKSQDIRAVFFVNGANVPAGGEGAAILQKLVTDGHLVANHTHNHPSLTADFPVTPAGNTARIKEITDTDALIAPFVQDEHFLFRAPFGDWNDAVFQALQASPMKKYVGHVHWDVGEARTATTGADWACWQTEPKLTTKACGDLHLAEVNLRTKGIVLMHDADYGDNANAAVDAGVGNTIDMVKYLVPKLKAAGYTFKRADEVPAIAALLPAAKGPEGPKNPGAPKESVVDDAPGSSGAGAPPGPSPCPGPPKAGAAGATRSHAH